MKEPHKCSVCDGKVVIAAVRFRGGYFASSTICRECGGTGTVWWNLYRDPERPKEEEA